MAGWFGKLIASLGMSQVPGNEHAASEPAATESPGETKGAGTATESAAAENDANRPTKSDDGTSLAVMVEVLRLLSRIEYGLDEEQMALSLAISPEEVLANCQVLEEEMFIHHHEDLKEWFIGQRGLEFLRLNADSDSKS
jgi:hypothetical protein